jgi:hypothetical protein
VRYKFLTRPRNATLAGASYGACAARAMASRTVVVAGGGLGRAGQVPDGDVPSAERRHGADGCRGLPECHLRDDSRAAPGGDQAEFTFTFCSLAGHDVRHDRNG